MSASWLKSLAREHGADDVGLVEITRPALADQLGYIHQVYPAKQETLYVIANSDAEAHAQVRYPHKTLKRVHVPLGVASIPSYVAQLQLGFQRGQAKGSARP